MAGDRDVEVEDPSALRAFSVQVITPLSFKEQACVIDMYSFLFHESAPGPTGR